MFEYWLLIILCSISVSQILLILFYLLVKKKGSNTHKIMFGSLLIIWSIFVVGSLILLMSGQSLFLYDLGHLMNLTIFLVAPLLYIYSLKLFNPNSLKNYKIIIHSIPFILVFLYSFNQIVIEKELFYVFTPTAIKLLTLLFLQNIVYFVLILKDINRLQNGKKDESKLKIFRFLLISTIIIFSLKLIIFLIWNVFQNTELCIFLTSIFFVTVFIIVNSTIIFSLNFPELLVGSFKYQYSQIDKQSLDEYLKRISDYLLSDKAYTDPLLSQEKLSKKIKIQKNLISQVINESTGLNFNDYINKLRIDFAKKLFFSEKDKNILEIAYMSGFNSKTTFNNAFKKFTNKTPTEFRKSL